MYARYSKFDCYTGRYLFEVSRMSGIGDCLVHMLSLKASMITI